MKFNSWREPRKQIRLAEYNYKTPGYYFVTFCTEKRLCLFGEIINSAMLHNEAGRTIYNVFKNLRNFYFGIHTDTFVVMPNHIHAIIVIAQEGRTQRSAPTGDSLSNVIKNIKTYTTRCYCTGVDQKNWTPFYKRLWQRGYYEHVIRDAKSLQKIREYIIQNPLCWNLDPDNVKLAGTNL
ncbi:MAG: transposase [Gammaproteobacteria bacterium]|nr:transposase [Gammaproteobacteria bacterium]